MLQGKFYIVYCPIGGIFTGDALTGDAPVGDAPIGDAPTGKDDICACPFWSTCYISVCRCYARTHF